MFHVQIMKAFRLYQHSSKLLSIRAMSSGSYIKNHIPVNSEDMLTKIVNENDNKKNESSFLKKVYPYL